MAKNNFNKAKIIVMDKKGKEIKTISVLFNPSEYSISNSNDIKEQDIKGLDGKTEQFLGGGRETLSMKLFFDTYTMRTDARSEYQDVRDYTKEIKNLMNIYSDDHAPPMCAVTWGSLYFKGYLESLNERYTMFSSEGVPLRAYLDVSFKKVETVEEYLKGASFQSADRTKERILKDGDQLWTIAHNEYDDAGNWRPIAKANGIDNPRKIKPGTSLIVPSLE
ncbi:LysM peptidoglycan-binding domain-containing protein [Wukongibacter baidiensis]|uniref:CIS tube protein n=1 Tax=Wukongibacter baidiensis TaxID=1723361 RepID=UPI003D7F2E8F